MSENTILLNNIVDLKLVKYLENSIIYTGNYNNDFVIIEIKNKILPINAITDLENIKLICDNDRFYKYNAEINSKCEMLIICPAKDDDFKKYCQKDLIKILETPEMYYTNIYPKIIKQNLNWINNIMSGTKESEHVIYNDNDIILIPDLKWNNKIIDDMYYLVIFKNNNLKSIRDLDQTHLPLLDKVKEICTKKIKELHNIDSNKLRLYFHYHPSFWQLHLHINLVKKSWDGTLVDTSHLLMTVIINIKLVNDYYQKMDIEICHGI